MIEYNKNIPYNNLPYLPPRVELQTKEILIKIISASRSLAQLNGALTNLPNPNLFLDTIHLLESKASSEIENIITTNDDLYQSIVAERKIENPATKEVLNYKEALWLGLDKLKIKPFITTNLCIEIVQCINQNNAGIRVTHGTKLANSKGDIIYTPPEGTDIIRDKMTNLENFINTKDDLDPLIKMALMHYQFEAIHPFADGNGRTGRILLLLYLKKERLLDIPAIFLSEYIIENKNEYYKSLRTVTEKNCWNDIILFMLNMIETTAKRGLKRLDSIVTLMNEMTEQIKNTLPKIYSKELIEIIFKLPYCKRQMLMDSGLGTSKTVGNYLIKLEEEGFLKSQKVGKEKLYLNHRLMNLLEK